MHEMYSSFVLSLELSGMIRNGRQHMMVNLSIWCERKVIQDDEQRRSHIGGQFLLQKTHEFFLQGGKRSRARRCVFLILGIRKDIGNQPFSLRSILIDHHQTFSYKGML